MKNLADKGMLNTEIHLWTAYSDGIQEAHLIKNYFSFLSEEEKQKQQHFYFEKDRFQYLMTRAMVRLILSYYIPAIAPAEWVFSKALQGKPFIANRSLPFPLFFNVSHTEKMIVLAVSSRDEIGVDVETLSREVNFEGLAKKIFSFAELKKWDVLSLKEKKNYFFKLWTLKEAYIKACGRGLSVPLKKIAFDFENEYKIIFSADESIDKNPERWQFWMKTLDSSYHIAIAHFAPFNVIVREAYPPILSNSQYFS